MLLAGSLVVQVMVADIEVILVTCMLERIGGVVSVGDGDGEGAGEELGVGLGLTSGDGDGDPSGGVGFGSSYL